MSDSYLDATGAELIGAPPARRLSGTHVVLRGGARIMRRRLIAALMAGLIVVCVSGCHFGVTVHAGPARHGSSAGR